MVRGSRAGRLVDQRNQHADGAREIDSHLGRQECCEVGSPNRAPAGRGRPAQRSVTPQGHPNRLILPSVGVGTLLPKNGARRAASAVRGQCCVATSFMMAPRYFSGGIASQWAPRPERPGEIVNLQPVEAIRQIVGSRNRSGARRDFLHVL